MKTIRRWTFWVFSTFSNKMKLCAENFCPPAVAIHIHVYSDSVALFSIRAGISARNWQEHTQNNIDQHHASLKRKFDRIHGTWLEATFIMPQRTRSDRRVHRFAAKKISRSLLWTDLQLCPDGIFCDHSRRARYLKGLFLPQHEKEQGHPTCSLFIITFCTRICHCIELLLTIQFRWRSLPLMGH